MQTIFKFLGKLSLHRRFFFYFSFFLLTWTFCLFLFLQGKKSSLDNLSDHLQKIYGLRNSSLEKRIFKKNFLSQFHESDPQYLEKYIVPLSLLSEEIRELSSLVKHPAFFMRNDLHERLAFLKSSSNRIIFQEEKLLSSRWIKEAEVSFLHPVEIDQNDLEKILSLIEGTPSQNSFAFARPQLIIKAFDLKKNHKKEDKETFSLHLKLLKREFLKESIQ